MKQTEGELKQILKNIPNAVIAFSTGYGESIVASLAREQGPDIRLTFAERSVTLARKDLDHLKTVCTALLDIAEEPR